MPTPGANDAAVLELLETVRADYFKDTDVSIASFGAQFLSTDLLHSYTGNGTPALNLPPSYDDGYGYDRFPPLNPTVMPGLSTNSNAKGFMNSFSSSSSPSQIRYNNNPYPPTPRLSTTTHPLPRPSNFLPAKPSPLNPNYHHADSTLNANTNANERPRSPLLQVNGSPSPPINATHYHYHAGGGKPRSRFNAVGQPSRRSSPLNPSSGSASSPSSSMSSRTLPSSLARKMSSHAHGLSPMGTILQKGKGKKAIRFADPPGGDRGSAASVGAGPTRHPSNRPNAKYGIIPSRHGPIGSSPSSRTTSTGRTMREKREKQKWLQQCQFRTKLGEWADRYYADADDEISDQHKRTIVALGTDTKDNKDNVQKRAVRYQTETEGPGPHLITVLLQTADNELMRSSNYLRRTGKYAEKIKFYKALRFLYIHFSVNGKDFESNIDPDGDWVMAYRTHTYSMIDEQAIPPCQQISWAEEDAQLRDTFYRAS